MEVLSPDQPRTLGQIETAHRLAITKQRIVASLVTLAGLGGLAAGALRLSAPLGWTGAVVFLVGLFLFYLSRRREDFRHIRRFPPEVRALIRSGTVRPGMTKEMVILALGNPHDVKRSIDGDGVHEEWVYRRADGDCYLHFDNGKLDVVSK